MVAVDSRRRGDFLPQGLHELEHGGLPEHVLQNDAVGMEKQIALARLDFLVFRVVKVSEQNLVRQGQWPAQPAPDDREIPLHRFVDLGCHFRSRFDRYHIFSPRFSLIVVSAPSGLGERRSERSSPPNGWAARLLNTMTKSV